MSVREARDDERAQALALRRAVFGDEQGVPLPATPDPRDETATHLVVVEGWTVVATCRLVPSTRSDPPCLRLSGLAVAPHARGQGHASALLADAAARALAGGFRTVVLHAQTRALGLYERAGYVPGGGRRTVAGIEHQTMELRVA